MFFSSTQSKTLFLSKLKDSEFPSLVSSLESTKLTKGGEGHVSEQEVQICRLLPTSAEIPFNEHLCVEKQGGGSPKA